MKGAILWKLEDKLTSPGWNILVSGPFLQFKVQHASIKMWKSLVFCNIFSEKCTLLWLQLFLSKCFCLFVISLMLFPLYVISLICYFPYFICYSTWTCSKITCDYMCDHMWSHVITCNFGTCSCGIFVRVGHLSRTWIFCDFT